MSLTSYAHNFEDVLLMRALRHVERGFYIDTAAGDPLRSNTTQAFYERGWHGINLEPSPTLLNRLRIGRPADINLAVGAAAVAGPAAYFELENPLDSTFDEVLAQQHRAAGHAVVQHHVTLQTLNAICTQHAPDTIHFLKLAHAAALSGLDLQRWRPWVIVLCDSSTVAHPALLAARYSLAHADGYNHFYVAIEHAELAPALALAPHPSDNFILSEDHHYSHPLAAWRQRTAEAEAEAQVSRTWAQAHVREWREKFERLSVEQRRAERAELQLAQMSTRARAAEEQLPHLTARAAAAAVAEQTLSGVYASLSWRITRPLRNGKLQLSRLRGWLRALPRRLVHAVLRRAKGLAGYALRYVNARPRLSFFLRRTISRLPWMVPLMRALKLRLQLNHNHVGGAGLPAPIALDHLPETARQVFDDLRRSRR